MIHLHTSKTFNNDLDKAGCHLPPVENKTDGWHWYAHRITLMRRKCVIVMEETSRYALLFVGLKKPGFAHFDKLLTSRIVVKASGLCKLPHPGPNEQLIAAVKQKCSSIAFSQGLDRSVQAHITQVAFEAEIHIHYHLDRLPESAEEEFALGLRISDTLRKRKGDKDYFVPYKVWRDSLMALIAPQTGSNVVNLADFRKGRGE